MMIKKALLVLFLFLLVSVSWAADFEGALVVKVNLKGNVNTSSALIMAQLTTKPGTRFKMATVSKDLKDLYFLGYFSDIKIDAKKIPGGVVLSFIFVEFEKIGSIVINGNDELSDKKIKEVMTLKKDAVYNKILLKKNISEIIKKYKSEGYINAKVTSSVKADKKTRKVTVTLKVIEGDEIVIEKISVFGVKQLEPSSVLGAIEDTHESGLFRSGIFEADKFKLDEKKIIKYYHDRGFIDMTIEKVEQKVKKIKPDKPKKGIYLNIYIKEGKRFKTGSISFEGNKVFSAKDIKTKFFRLKTGEHYNESQQEKDFHALRNGYNSRGYIFATIVPMKNVDRKKMVVNYKYRINESTKAHIENITIKGNDRTKLFVLKREVRVKEGEIFNGAKIGRSRQRLMNLRFFKDVAIDVTPGSSEGLMNLIFSVKEDRTGLFTMGAGYGTVSGFTVYEQISENNFLGLGLKIHERLDWGESKKSIEVGIDSPYFFKYDPTSLGFSISYSDLKISDVSTNYIDVPNSPLGNDDEYFFKRKTFQIQLRGGRPISEYWKAYGAYTFAWMDSYDANFSLRTNTSDPLYIDNEEYITDLDDALTQGFTTKSSFRLGLIYDTRDLVAGPSSGIYLRQFFTYTGGLLGADSDYIQLDTDFSFYVPLMWNFVFAVEIKTEFLLDQFDGTSSIYPGDEAYFNGMNELRGWRDYDESGRAKIATLMEIRYPIDKQMLWGVLFYDTGKLWSDFSNLKLGYKEFKHSLGFGFRLQMAMLPIRIYFAKKFDYDSSGNIQWAGGDRFFKGWETVFSVAGIF